MWIVWRNARVFDMVRELLARALHRLCGTSVVGKYGACGKVVHRDEFFIAAEGTV